MRPETVPRALLALLAALPVSGLAGCHDPDVPYPGHAAVLANTHEYGPVELSRLIRSARASGDPERIFVASLASYLVDAARYEQRFVEAFPAERSMGFVYEQLELQRLTPSLLYTFVELGRIAMDGSRDALAKLVATASHSDLAPLAVLCDALVHVLAVHTGAALEALDEVPRRERGRVYRCFGPLQAESARELLEQLQEEAGTAPFVEGELRDLLGERSAEPHASLRR